MAPHSNTARRRFLTRRTCNCPTAAVGRLSERLSLLAGIEHQREHMQRVARVQQHARFREQAISVLADPTTKGAFDVENADPKHRRAVRQEQVWAFLFDGVSAVAKRASIMCR